MHTLTLWKLGHYYKILNTIGKEIHFGKNGKEQIEEKEQEVGDDVCVINIFL